MLILDVLLKKKIFVTLPLQSIVFVFLCNLSLVFKND